MRKITGQSASAFHCVCSSAGIEEHTRKTGLTALPSCPHCLWPLLNSRSSPSTQQPGREESAMSMAPGPGVLLGLFSDPPDQTLPVFATQPLGVGVWERHYRQSSQEKGRHPLSHSLGRSCQQFGYVLDSKARADEEVEKSRTQSTSVRRTAAPAALNDMLTRSVGGQDQAMGVEH